MSEKVYLTVPMSIDTNKELNLIPMAISADQIVTITAYINQYRALNQAPPIVWDNSIAIFSQYWSDYLLKNNLFQHSNNQIYGENLSYFKGYGVDPITLLKIAVKGWYDEILLYDFNKPGFSSATGHFTTLVWKSCTKFGMGFSVDTNTNTVIVSYNCLPPSNYLGQFIQNVLPVASYVPPPLPIPIPIPIPPNPNPLPPPIQTTCTKSYVITSLTNIKNNVLYRGSNNLTITMINNLINKVIMCPNM